MPHAHAPHINTPPIPPGGLSWGAFVRVACVTQRPLGHAWLGHPGAPGHVCRGQPWGPSSRSAARAPPPGACLPRPGARPPLCPRPPVILPSNGVQAPAPPPAPAPTRHAPCDPVPSSRSRMAGRAPRPRPPRSPERQPPSTARSPRSPRTPTPPPARRCAALCGGARGAAGGRPRPLHFFQECAPHAPRPCPTHQHPPDTPRGSFLGGLCQGCLCHPAAPWSRLAGSPRSPGSRLPGSALGPFVTLRCPRPAPGGLPAAAGGATASLSPPPCHSPLQRRAGSRAAPRSRPHQTRPLRPCPLLAVTHGWAGAAPPTPPFP